MLAAQRGSTEVVIMLLEAGGVVNETEYNSGSTALMRAAFGGHEVIVTRLLEFGADAHAKSRNVSLCNFHLLC